MLRLSVLLVTGLCMWFSSVSAFAQVRVTKEQVIGTWTFKSVTAQRPDSTSFEPWGPKPHGTYILSANGRFAVQVMRSDLPNFASNNRLKGSPEENQTVVHGSLAYFGTFTVDEAGGAILFRIEGSTYPNWKGDTQKRIITAISANEMVIENPTGSAGARARITLIKTP
jgi:hypothetical protein